MISLKKIFYKYRSYLRYRIFIIYGWCATHLKGMLGEKFNKRKMNSTNVHKDIRDIFYGFFRKNLGVVKKRKNGLRPVKQSGKQFWLFNLFVGQTFGLQYRIFWISRGILGFFYTILYDFIEEFTGFYFYDASVGLLVFYLPYNGRLFLVFSFGDYYWFFSKIITRLSIKFFHIFKKLRVYFKRFNYQIFISLRIIRGFLPGMLNKTEFGVY